MIGRLLELFEGPEAPGPWMPPAMPAALHSLLPWRAWDESSELYVNAASTGFVDRTAALRRASTPRPWGHCRARWRTPRRSAAQYRSSTGRARASARPATPGPSRAPAPAARSRGWVRGAASFSAAAAGASCMAAGRPSRSRDYRVFVTACLAGGPGPAAETSLGAFRRALEGTLASAGAHARRLEPDALLSLAAELTVPDIHGDRDGGTRRPVRRWSPRDPIHEQCIAPGRALTVAPTGLTFHGADGEDVAVADPLGRRVPGGLAGLARQRADRRFPPRLPPAGLSGADDPDRDDRRRGGGREGLSQVGARDSAGRHRHRALPPRPAREGARLAGGDRAAEGRRAAGPGLLHGRGLCAARCARRGRAGGARDLSRPGLAGERGALRPAPLLARLPADGVRRRSRRRSRTHGPHEDTAHRVGRQPRAGAWRVARPADEPGQPARPLPDRAPAASLPAGRPSPTRPATTTSRSRASLVRASRC